MVLTQDTAPRQPESRQQSQHQITGLRERQGPAPELLASPLGSVLNKDPQQVSIRREITSASRGSAKKIMSQREELLLWSRNAGPVLACSWVGFAGARAGATGWL